MKTESAILAIIKMYPDITGYQIKTNIDAMGGNVVKIHLSKIYPCLKKMTEQGLLSCRSVPQEGRLDQKFYTLTPAGEKALDEYYEKPFEFKGSRASFDEYLLQLANMAYMPNERIVSYIDEGISYMENSLAADEARLDDESAEEALTGMDEQSCRAYADLWKRENELVAREARGRIEWLKELREAYSA
jgi:DNA-binding PadR family transcriptional regulator